MADLLERLRSALADRYVVERELGRGGMATVLLAEDLKHRRKVAIKVLHPELAVTLAAERFLNEVQIAAGLNHPHILSLIDSGEADGLPYYVMPYVEGESLRERLDREGELPVEEAVRIAVEVADGLQHAHERGVVHRDVKPGNVLLSGRHAVIADFGIARAVTAAQEGRMTGTGLGVGTPLYASPEQATGAETLDGRTDVYSLGCVLYEMLTGEVPLTAATPQAVQARRLVETPAPIHSQRETVPPLLDQVVAKALAKRPADRWESAEAFGQALMAGTTSPTGGAPPERTARTRSVVIAAGAVGILALLIYGATSLARRPAPADDPPEIHSVAVLPLRNLSGDPNQQHIVEGMTDGLITGLGQLSALEKVPSLTTMLRYQDMEMTLPEIARDLGVDAILEGSLQWAVNDVQIRLRLIHGAVDKQLWSGEFAGRRGDALALQKSVVEGVADGVQLALSVQELARRAQPAYSSNPDALEAYLNGRSHARRWTREEVRQASGYFEKALAIDPDFILARAALVETRCIMFPSLHQLDLAPDPAECESLAGDVIDSEPGIAEAHAALAMARNRQWDWRGAEAEFRTALELDPNAVWPRAWYGWFLTQVSRPEEGLIHARRAESLEPDNPFVSVLVTQPLLNLHRYDEALAQTDSVLRLDPDHGAAFIYRAHIHALRDEAELAGAATAQAELLFGEDLPQVVALRALVAALEGDEKGALELLETREEALQASQVYAYLALGREDEALNALERSYHRRDEWLPNLTSAPQVDPIRDHPRFRELRQAMGLPAD